MYCPGRRSLILIPQTVATVDDFFDFPDLPLEINGGIKTLPQALSHFPRVDAVMLGRSAYETPYLLPELDQALHGPWPDDSNQGRVPSRRELISFLADYFEEEEAAGTPTHIVLRHLTGLLAYLPGTRRWKQLISPPWPRPLKGRLLMEEALETLPSDSLDRRDSALPDSLGE